MEVVLFPTLEHSEHLLDIFHYFEKKQQPRMLVTWQLTSLCIPSLDLLYLFTTILLSLRFFMLWWFRSSINCLLVEVIYTHDAKARYSVSLSLVWQIWPASHSTTLSFLYLHYAIWIDESTVLECICILIVKSIALKILIFTEQFIEPVSNI